MLRKFVSSFKRLLGSRRFHSLSDQKTLAGKVLVAYLPLRQQGWILDFLWKDLCKQLKLIAGVEVGIAVSPEDLSRRSAGKDIFVVAMGLKQLNELIDMGFPPCRIIFYHTHVRLGHAIKKLDLVHAVLVLNGFERELIAMRKVDRNRIHLFPAGYDHLLFKHSNAEIGRPIDVLFVGRYRQGKDGYYHQRKRYGFQVELANRLLENGLNIAFLGGEWSQCEYDLSSRVKIIESENKNLRSIFSFYRDGFLVAGLSPKSIIFFGTIFTSFIDFSSNYFAQFLILIITYVALDFFTLMIYALAANKVSLWLKDNPKVLNTISACVLIIIAIYIAVTQSY